MSRRKNGAISSTKSATRSATLKALPSQRKGKKNVPRSAQTVGLVRRPAPDPSKKSWPTHCIVVVAASPATFRPSQIRGHVVDKKCKDCGARLCVDSQTITDMENHSMRQRRPIEFLGVDCCFSNYETNGVHMTRAPRKDGNGEVDG